MLARMRILAVMVLLVMVFVPEEAITRGLELDPPPKSVIVPFPKAPREFQKLVQIVETAEGFEGVNGVAARLRQGDEAATVDVTPNTNYAMELRNDSKARLIYGPRTYDFTLDPWFQMPPLDPWYVIQHQGDPREDPSGRW